MTQVAATGTGAGPCPLCATAGSSFLYQDRRRYWRCPNCALVFVDRAGLPTREAEQACYDLHQNQCDDPGYRTFLQRAAQPILDQLAPPARGLDFGCGPGPTLSVMLRAAGFEMQDYDPLYRPDSSLLCRRYEFITCTEVVEHVHQAQALWPRLLRMLVPGGRLVVMTKRVVDDADFAAWHYKNDPTHVRFYAAASFRWLARVWGLDLDFVAADVVVFRVGLEAGLR